MRIKKWLALIRFEFEAWRKALASARLYIVSHVKPYGLTGWTATVGIPDARNESSSHGWIGRMLGSLTFRGGDSGNGDLLFFSRRIGIDPITGIEVPVNGGAKVTGSLGNFELGAMEVNTRQLRPNPSTNYAVMRVKRSLWGGSYVGVMGIDKRSGNPLDSYNQTTGADTRLVFFNNLVVNGYAAQTRTPGFSSGQTNLGAGFDYQTNWREVFAQHRKVGPNFNPVVGFLGRTDCICDYVDVNFKPRPKIRGVRDLNFESFLFHAPDTHHVLQTQEWQGTFRIDFITVPTATMILSTSSYNDWSLLPTFTRTFLYRQVNTIGIGISSLTDRPKIVGG
ncbi:MAG: hypothetical protein NVS1B11_31760 [Terriglobales bacterium]